MTNKLNQKLIIAGIGPGKPELITIEAINQAKSSDVIIIPRSHDNVQSVSEKIILQNIHGSIITYITFPMIYDEQQRNNLIFSQLLKAKPKWEHAHKIFFPVIGDSTLFSTGAYLFEAFKKIIPDIDIEFIPGVSAHSLAAACAKKFVAQSDEILTIIPGTADRNKIQKALSLSDTVAIYKPTAIRNLHELTEGFHHIIRVDFAGIPEREKIYTGLEALHNIKEYLSIILLWK